MPTPEQRRELASMGPERLEQERDRWQVLKASVEAMRGHPLMPQLERIGSQAGALWQRNAMLLNMPGGGEQIVKNWQQMGELYSQASELRARMMGARIQAELGVEPGAAPGIARDAFMDRLNESFSLDGGNNGPMRAINRTLSRYAQGLSADPNAVLDGGTNDGYFYGRNRRSGKLLVNWNRVEDAYRNIDMIAGSSASAVNPEQRRILEQMRAGIRQVEAIDPVGAVISDWRRSYPVHQTDHRPLRLLTGVGASLITGIGLYMGARSGSFTWPTALWAGIAALSINPDLARSQTFNAVKRLDYLNRPETINLMQRGAVSGERGAEAIEELQELRRSRRREFDMLLRNPATMAQIGQLTEGENTALTETLARMENDQQRSEFLRTFSQPRSRDEQQIVREFIRGRGRIDPRLEPSRFLFGGNPNANA